MDVLDVAITIVFTTKLLGAKVTRERFLVCMHDGVAFEMGGAGEGLATRLAIVPVFWLFFLFRWWLDLRHKF